MPNIKAVKIFVATITGRRALININGDARVQADKA
jgi:hypothetical protein